MQDQVGLVDLAYQTVTTTPEFPFYGSNISANLPFYFDNSIACVFF